MKDAQKPDRVGLNTLVNRLKEGHFVIPDFQRDFEWRPWDIGELMRSIFLDYYIGSLLLWKGKKENFEALSCEAVFGHDRDKNPQHIVLDGQQRLTAMYYAFLAPDSKLPNKARRAFYFIRVDQFMAEAYDKAFVYEWGTKYWTDVAANREKQYESHLFPLAVIGKGGWELYGWVQEYEQFWNNRATLAETSGQWDAAAEASKSAANARAFGKHVREITEEYQVSYIELDKDLPVDKVCDIFTQINSKGVRLDVFDLMNALLKPKDLRLKHLWHAAESRLARVETPKMNVYILQVMSILRQGYCSPKYLYFLLPGQEKPIREPDGTRRKEILIRDTTEFQTLWDEAVAAIESAIQVLFNPQDYGVISSAFLPYVSILPVFAALRAHTKSIKPERRLDAGRKLRHWYWASVFTNRYSGSVESTSARDFQDVKAWFDDDASEPGVIDDLSKGFRGLDLKHEVKRGTSVYNGIFNLLVLQSARDWMSGDLPQVGDLDDHHIVPASWGAKNPTDTPIGTILNRTPLTSETNRHVINDRLPNEYLPELIRQNGENTVRSVLESHFISPAAFDILLRDPFTPADFEAFVGERQRTISAAIEALLIKERLDLTPQLRDLDAAVEGVELRLRQLVETTAGSESEIPPHLLQKVALRIAGALKKNAAMDKDRYTTLAGMLEYFDMRDLQEAIGSKSLWSKFEPLFRTKEALATKFDQLAELRNGIRHSRTVSEIVRKEGEAAILWFRAVLDRGDAGGDTAAGASA